MFREVITDPILSGYTPLTLKRDGGCNPVPNVLRVAELSSIEGYSRFMLS